MLLVYVFKYFLNQVKIVAALISVNRSINRINNTNSTNSINKAKSLARQINLILPAPASHPSHTRTGWSAGGQEGHKKWEAGAGTAGHKKWEAGQAGHKKWEALFAYHSFAPIRERSEGKM